MVEICAIASGSNGNCYYVGNETEAVLVDVGISRRQVVDRMKKVGLSINKVKAIFITHEHSDHSQGVRVLSSKFNIPVYMTTITFKNSRETNRPESFVPLLIDETITVGRIKIKAFSKRHDASDPCSFNININDFNVGVLTDVGSPCENVIANFKLFHAVFLETNYDEQMLTNGSYPDYLKYRVGSNRGHLSNDQAIQLVQNHGNEQLKHIFLSHISEDNNHPTLIMKTFDSVKSQYQLHLTNRYAPTDVLRIT